MLLHAVLIACHSRRGVLFKLVDDDRFIGHASGSRKLTLVPYDRSIRFVLEDHSNQAQKKLVNEDKTEMLTQHGWSIFRKTYKMDPYSRGDRNGFNIVYSAPNVYILMRDGKCLSAASGIFRKIDCTDKDVNKFRMCKNRRCREWDADHVNRNLEFIRCALSRSMMNDYDLALRSGGERYVPHRHGDSDESGDRRHRHRSGGNSSSSSGWDGDAFSNILGLAPTGEFYQRKCPLGDQSCDPLAGTGYDNYGFGNGSCRIAYDWLRRRYNGGNANC